jgi:8-oxo-dGTP diphosphatase
MKISVAIVCHDMSVLLIRRKKREGNLLWQFPAGQIEQGEKSADAAVREVFEETAVFCRVEKKLGKRVHPETHVDIHYWLCTFLSGQPTHVQDEETAEAIWCPIKDIKLYIKTDIFPAVFDYLQGKLTE